MSTTTTGDTPAPAQRITKRKLDDAISILDSAFHEKAFGDSSSSHESSSPPSSKRRALGVRSIYATLAKYGFKSNDATTKEKTASLRTPRLTALLDKSKAATTSAPKSPSNYPHISSPQALISRPPFRPTSAPDFLARLSTFKLATYRDKPRQIDAVVAARCGWKNDGLDRLVCEYCSATWVVASTAGMSRDAANTLVERQRVGMTTTHKESCSWRTRQCDDSIYRVPMKGSTIMAREIYHTASALTLLVKDVVLKHPLTSAQVAHLESTILSVAPSPPEQRPDPNVSEPQPTPSPPIKPSETALILALFGWELYVPNSSSTPRTTGVLPPSLARSATIGSNSGHARSSSGGTPYRTTASMSSAAARGKARHSYDGGASTSLTGFPTAGTSSSSASVHSNDTVSDSATVISCALCQRRVGVWGFRANTSSGVSMRPVGRSASGGSSGTGETSVPSISSTTHQPQPQQQRVLDVVKEHRSYCPYIVRSTPLPTFSFSLTTPTPQQRPTSASSQSPSQSFPLTRAISHPATTPTTTKDASPESADAAGQVTEGWRAVLSVVGRAGMGRRRRMSRRRRSDQMGMEIRMAADAVREVDGEAEAEGEGEGEPQHQAGVADRAAGASLEANVEGDVDMDEADRKVDEMVESVKRGGGMELLRYVKGLLGS